MRKLLRKILFKIFRKTWKYLEILRKLLNEKIGVLILPSSLPPAYDGALDYYENEWKFLIRKSITNERKWVKGLFVNDVTLW